MALLPSLTLSLGALLLWAFRGRRARLTSLLSAALAALFVLLMFPQLPLQTRIVLWRPGAIFGPGFEFTIDAPHWLILLAAAAAILAETILDGGDVERLLYAAVSLAAIAAASSLTLVMLWTLLIAIEMVLRLRQQVEVPAVLRLSGLQSVAVAAILAATILPARAGVLIVLAALIRSLGGNRSWFPISLAVLAPLTAVAAINRAPLPSAAFPWLAGAVIAAAVLRALFPKPRVVERPLGLLQQISSTVWGTLTGVVRTTAEVLEGDSAVLWILLALLIAIIGLQAVVV